MGVEMILITLYQWEQQQQQQQLTGNFYTALFSDLWSLCCTLKLLTLSAMIKNQ